jgi:hypothetical protein
MGVVWVQTPAAGVRTYGDIMAEQQLAKARIFKSDFYSKYISALSLQNFSDLYVLFFYIVSILVL